MKLFNKTPQQLLGDTLKVVVITLTLTYIALLMIVAIYNLFV
jgi:hypothetical protein